MFTVANHEMSKSLASGSRRSSGLSARRAAIGGLVAAASVLALPLALAWACVPGATIGFDRAVYDYRAGETVTVLGKAFAPNTRVTLLLQSPAGSETPVGHDVTTDSIGNFRDFFALEPTAGPGAYVTVATVNTIDVDGHGRTYEARESFRVLAPRLITPPPTVVQTPLPAPAIARAARSITLAAHKAHAARKTRLALTGKVTAVTNTKGCAARQSVLLQRRRRSGGHFKTFSRVRSDSRGKFRKRIRPTRTYTYRARLPETARCLAAVSKSKRMRGIAR